MTTREVAMRAAVFAISGINRGHGMKTEANSSENRRTLELRPLFLGPY